MKETSRLVGALRIERFIGRTGELAAIEDAIRAWGELRILYVIGDGGIGKTRLLEQVRKMVEARERSNPCRYVGPLDFYDSSVQSSGGLETAIREALDPQAQGFRAYDVARQQLERTRTAGGDPLEIERLKHGAERCFVQGFNEISAQFRVVLALDTVETIQYESDLVQETCQIELTGMEVKHWLLTNISSLQNAVVILAGRESPRLLADFRRHFGDWLRVLPLDQFNEGETLDYFDAVAEATPTFRQIGLLVDRRKVIHHYTGGLPMKLAFVIELLVRNCSLPQDFYDPLEKAFQKSDGELKDIQQRVEAELVARILTATDDIARALPYMALARKGINQELLCQLTGWSQEKGVQVLNDLRLFSFVKVRPDSDWLFLHDEMYDLLDRHIWNHRDLEREEISRIILEYYLERIKHTTDRLQRQDLQVEQLYYQFLADPREGYAEYTRLSDGALYDNDESFDMRLRDEMLRFCNRYPGRAKNGSLTRVFIDYDAAVRWVKRYRFIRKYDKATQVAGAAKARWDVDQAANDDFRLARADLDVNHAIALIYKGQTEEGINMLKAVIASLEGKPQPNIPAVEGVIDSFHIWRRNLILGLAHNNLGYAYWMNWGRYRAALEEFHSALPYFLTANLEEEIANTSDNMGRVYALLGDRTRAGLLVRDGLELRRRLGRELRIGLSLNSQIILRSSFGDPYGAYRLSRQRLQTFECLGAQREIGAASFNLGRSLRRLGALRKTSAYEDEECNKFLSDAIEHLKKAIEIFSQTVNEPIRLIEAYNELGCVYRERAAQVGTMDPDTLLNQEEQSAVQYLNRAIDLAQKKEYWVQYVDSYEDLAQVYFQAGHLDKAEDCLGSAEKAIPDAYRIREGLGLQDIPIEECSEESWWQMGKIEILRGHLTFDRGRRGRSKVSRAVLEQALPHYAFAATYFGRYSGRATRLQIAFEQLYDNFKHCNHDDLEYAQGQVLPAVAVMYNLDASRLAEFFEDTLGLAVRTTK